MAPDDSRMSTLAATPRLDAIGLKYGTDKSSWAHGYLDFYERFFRDLRDQPVRLLEIGVLKGQSVRMWRDYFPFGQVVGIDSDSRTGEYSGDRITIVTADQSDVAQLVDIGAKYGPFDIVIDDGSHLWNHQITSLRYLYPFVRRGGFYVVEDLHTSYGPHAEAYRGASSISAAGYLQKMSDYLVGDDQLPIDAEEDPFVRSFARATEFIAFHRRTAVLRRRLPALSAALIEAAAAAPFPGASLTAHVGYVGDITSWDVLVSGATGNHDRTIQGFQIDLPSTAANELEYKARLGDGQWTDWTPCGHFCGSRGASAALRGFAVRLRGGLAANFGCVYWGAFGGHAGLVEACDGAHCAGHEGAPLLAMQIALRPR